MLVPHLESIGTIAWENMFRSLKEGSAFFLAFLKHEKF